MFNCSYKTTRPLFSLLFFLNILVLNSSFGGEIEVKGVYQNKNLFVMNPFASGGKFCIKEIKVNGNKTSDFLNSSAVEIDLSTHQLQVGQSVVITIIHSDECKPKIINPEVLRPQSTFEIKSIKIDLKTNQLQWETTKESGPLPYVVEQYRWNKWIPIGQVEGKGDPNQNTYSFPITLHSGPIRLRVRQTNFDGEKRYSREATVRSPLPPVTYEPKKIVNSITFSNETDYEIWDMKGNRLLQGRGKTVDLTSLPKGDYFLNYDATTEIIKKTK